MQKKNELKTINWKSKKTDNKKKLIKEAVLKSKLSKTKNNLNSISFKSQRLLINVFSQDKCDLKKIYIPLLLKTIRKTLINW